MIKIDLDSTKQSQQIKDLKHSLSRVGWRIIAVEEKIFNGKSIETIENRNSNLICQWKIQRNPTKEPLVIDFMASNDWLGQRMLGNDCCHCVIENTEICLLFSKDRNLKNPNGKLKWKEKLTKFIHAIPNC